ncbi:transaldolase family protein [Streptomyces sp. NPDC051162]|uniref:transaldolase family protein n=1 Tax=Streptomyces sp. NPDC051162 TaxID=3154747 RepID=UPI0034442BE4
MSTGPSSDENDGSGVLGQLAAEGVSLWLGGLRHGHLADGTLARAVAEGAVRGAVADPLPAEDIRGACDVLREAFAATHGKDGWVSAAPGPAPEAARSLADAVARPNVLIRTDASDEGLATAADCLARGIGVHVGPVCGPQGYAAAADAYFHGLERASGQGRDLTAVAAVVQVDVDRLGDRVDALLAGSADPAAGALRGTAALAAARLVYRTHDELLGSARWRALVAHGARPPRPLWATDARGAAGLVGWGTVSALSPAALEDLARHGSAHGDTLTCGHRAAGQVVAELERLGIPFDETARSVERAGCPEPAGVA